MCGVEGAKVTSGGIVFLAVLHRSQRRSSKLGHQRSVPEIYPAYALRGWTTCQALNHTFYTHSLILAPSPVSQGAEDVITLFLQVKRLRLRDD